MGCECTGSALGARARQGEISLPLRQLRARASLSCDVPRALGQWGGPSSRGRIPPALHDSVGGALTGHTGCSAMRVDLWRPRLPSALRGPYVGRCGDRSHFVALRVSSHHFGSSPKRTLSLAALRRGLDGPGAAAVLIHPLDHDGRQGPLRTWHRSMIYILPRHRIRTDASGRHD